MDVIRHCSSFLLPSPSHAAGTDGRPTPAYALVVLNQRLPRFTPLLWEHAQVRMCADGGANRVYDEMPGLLPHEDAVAIRNRYKPEVIKGDMDSIRTEIMDFYRKLGTKIVDESHDQDTTDLHKCVSYIRDSTPELDKSNLCILVAGALGGRFDHEIGNINVLCRFSDMRIILISDDCLIQLLPRTHHHEIHILSSVEGPHCGLVPIGIPSKSTTTTGLQWDLDKIDERLVPIDIDSIILRQHDIIGCQDSASSSSKLVHHCLSSFSKSDESRLSVAADTEMKFGGLISTSNIAREETVTVRSDSDLLWTISIKKP